MLRKTLSVSALAAAALMITAPMSQAKDKVFGMSLPASHGVTKSSLVPMFADLKKQSGGSLSFNVVAGGQVVNIRNASKGISDRIVDAGLIVPVYVRKTLPSLNIMFDMQTFEGDPLAAQGATMEAIMFNCPDCLKEIARAKQVWLSNYSVTPFVLQCRKPVNSAADYNGRKIRASGATGRFAKVLGATTVNMPPTDGVAALQRGALDCVIGSKAWLTSYGYIDVVKNVNTYSLGAIGAVGLVVFNKQVWDGLTSGERAMITKAQPLAGARATIIGYMKKDETAIAEAKAKGIKVGVIDLSAAMKKHHANDTVFIPKLAKKMGAKRPQAIMDAYNRLLPKWRKIGQETGGDVDKYAAALQREIYSKLDPDKL